MLNLIFEFDSDKILRTVLTISELPLSIAVSNDLGKHDAKASYPSKTPLYNIQASMRCSNAAALAAKYPPCLFPLMRYV
jgi:hypothetical protein